MKTTKLAGLILGAMCALVLTLKAAPPEDTILKQLDTQLKDAPGKVDEKAESQFGAGRVFVGSYASFRLIDIADTQHITGAGGVAVVGGYHVADNVALVAEGQTENTGHSVFDVANAGLQFFIPVKDSGFAFYGKVLAGREFEGEENWLGSGEAGFEVRGKRFGAFAGLRYTYDWESRSDLTPCIGLNYHFGTR